MRFVLDFHRDLEEALSFERFSRYLKWAGQDRQRAVELYTLNALVSESFYVPLEMLEVTLRNRIHRVMSDIAGETWFFDESRLAIARQHGQVRDAGDELRQGGKDITPGRLVAALPFSFWTSMVSPAYETAWQQGLHRIARTPEDKGLRRKEFSRPLHTLRVLRNRIAHHEPILEWNLPKHHDNILMLTGWLSPAAAAWCRQHSRFPSVHPGEQPVPTQPPT